MSSDCCFGVRLSNHAPMVFGRFFWITIWLLMLSSPRACVCVGHVYSCHARGELSGKVTTAEVYIKESGLHRAMTGKRCDLVDVPTSAG